MHRVHADCSQCSCHFCVMQVKKTPKMLEGLNIIIKLGRITSQIIRDLCIILMIKYFLIFY